VIFPASTRKEAMAVTDKLRSEIARLSKGFSSIDPNLNITISAGVATYPDDAEDREKLIYCADAALYEAKRAGKNRVRNYNKT